MEIANKEKIYKELNKFGKLDDKDIDVAETLLLISAIDKPGISLGSYTHHLNKLTELVKARFEQLVKAGAREDAATKIASLKHIIINEYKYESDSINYSNLENYDLIRTIDRKRGSSITISVIFIHIAKNLNWDIKGINFPSHFLLHIKEEGQRIIFNPADNCNILAAPELRQLAKKNLGEHAELSNEYYNEISNREILIRSINNVKFRLISDEEYNEALKQAELIIILCPKDYRPLLDTAILYIKTDKIERSIPLLERYIEEVPDYNNRQEAILLLNEIT